MLCLNCKGQALEIKDCDVIADGFINVNVVKFSFCERWSGMVKTAQFTQRKDGTSQTFSVLIDDLTGQAAMPNEVTAGDLMISAFGYDPDTGQRMTSTICVIKVLPSGFTDDGETPIPPTPDLYAQLVARVNAASGVPHIGDNGNWYIVDIDTGVQAQGPKGETGDTNGILYGSAQQLTAAQMEQARENISAANKETEIAVSSITGQAHSKNYLSPNDEIGSVLPDGSVTAYSDRRHTVKMPVAEGQYIIFSYTNSSGARGKGSVIRNICYYDENNAPMESVGVNSTVAYAVVPQNAKSACVTYLTSNQNYFNDAMISAESGNINPAYVPYEEHAYIIAGEESKESLEAVLRNSFSPYLPYVTPEMFGAVGDGVKDDTAALQNAIDFASQNGCELRSTGKKKYLVTQVSITAPLYFDGGGCTLIAASASSIMSVNRTVQEIYGNTRINGTVKNIIFDGDLKAYTLLYIVNDIRGVYENITFKNLGNRVSQDERTDENFGNENLSTALVYAAKGGEGGGNVFRNIFGEMQPDYGAYDTLLIDVRGYDSTFYNIDYQHFKFGIRITGVCFLHNFHGYITTKDIYPGSYCMRVGGYGQVIASEYYPDTQQYGTIIDNGGRCVIITNSYLYFGESSNIGKDAELVTEHVPHVLFVPDENAGQLEGVRLTGCNICTGDGFVGTYKFTNVTGANVSRVNCFEKNVAE